MPGLAPGILVAHGVRKVYRAGTLEAQEMSNTIFQSKWTGEQASGAPAGQTNFTFDVNIEGGALEFNDFDVYAEAGGADRAIVREFPVNVTDGKATIEFITVKENAKVSAIDDHG
jgi:hypothetical protein